MPFWLDNIPSGEDYETLSNNMETDILIIGGGIAWLTSAYCLTQQGYKIVLVEDGLLGSGESGRTTAHFTYALDDRYSHLEQVFGEKLARYAAESHMAAIDKVEEIVRKENIHCHFERVDGYLFVHSTDKEKTLRDELESARRLDIPLEWIDSVPHINVTSPCLKFPRQWQLHIMLYLHWLAKAITKHGWQIFTKSRATTITKEWAKVNGHMVHAKHIIVATNSPINDRGKVTSKQFPYRSYVVWATIKKGSLPHALRRDTGDHDTPWERYPYHYVRTEKYSDTHDILIFGWEDHKTGQSDQEHVSEEKRYDELIKRWKEKFPMIEEIVYKRSGQVQEPADAMAYIGRHTKDSNVYCITGDSGNGMTHWTLGWMIITDLIMGKKNKREELYSPDRSPWHAARTYVIEVANLMVQYGKYLTPGERKTIQSLKPGEGAVLRDWLKKVAVYRDEEGKLHTYSAVCPHLKWILVWNNDEKSFDCPVHGSRFDHDGKLVMWPAYGDLKKAEYSGD